MPLDYQTIKSWPFEKTTRNYSRDDLIAYARGFGAGLPGPLLEGDARFIDAKSAEALPMAAVPLADGQFWYSDPRAGLHWQQMVHAEEAITLHQPLPAAGTLSIERRVVEVYDRGADKGAFIHEQQCLRNEQDQLIVTIDVGAVLRADGGFGGASLPVKPKLIPARDPDEIVMVRTPSADQPVFKLVGDFDVKAMIPDIKEGQVMLRGVCSFGLAGRAILQSLCGNDPARLRRLAVRYAGPMLSDETMRVEVWRTEPGKAAFRMQALERNTLVLNQCEVELVM